MKKLFYLCCLLAFANGTFAQFSSSVSIIDASCWDASDGAYAVGEIEGCFSPISITIDSATYTFDHLTNDEYTYINHGAGIGNDIGYSVWAGMTSIGQVYIATGTFEDSVQFDTTTLYSNSLLDMFTVCFDASTSEVIWAFSGSAGGSTYTSGYGITGVGNKAYITGYMTGTCTMGNNSITSTGSYQAYIAKVDIPTGNVDTITQYGNAGIEDGYNLFYSSGRIYLLGDFSGNIVLAGNSYSSNGSQDGFVLCVDSSLAVDYWAAVFGGSGNDRPTDLTAFVNGGIVERVYLSGEFNATCTFGSQSIASAGGQDFFIAAIDTNGGYDWVETGGAGSNDYLTGIAINSTYDRLYAAGSWSGTMTFGGQNFTANANDDGFIAYMDTTGGLDSLYVLDGDAFEYILDVHSLDDDYLLFTAQFNSDVNYADSTFSSNGNLDAFVAKIGPDQHEIWGKNFGGTANDRFGKLAVGPNGSLHTVGFFQNDASAYQSGLISVGGADVVVTNDDIFGLVDTTILMTGLVAGTYYVEYNDSNGNSWVDTIVVDAPDSIAISGTITPESSSGANDAAIDITVTGGTLGYTYQWSNGSTTEDVDSLGTGVYCVTVTDSNGCVQTACFNTDTNATGGLYITANVTHLQCFGDSSGSIDITAFGASGTVTYAWSNGASSEDLTGIAAGTYYVTVSDNDTTLVDSFTVTEPAQIVITGTITPPSNGTSNDGAVDATVSGGVSPYTYSWSNSATTEDISGLAIGIYTLTVTDDNGCTAVKSFDVDTIPAMSLVSVASDVTCINTNNGAIDLTVIGGLPPFSYAWSNGATTEDINGLTAGGYSVTVTDSVGQIANLSDTVGSNPIHPDPTVGPITGPASAQAWTTYNYNVPSSSGSQFVWSASGGIVTSTASNAASIQWEAGPNGAVYVMETDVNGCIGSDSLEVVILFVGIDEGHENSIKVYPNPSSNVLNIDLPESFATPLVSLIDLHGRIVYTERASRTMHTISLEQLTGGVYTLQLELDDVRLSHKVIVQ